jgi:hypothetical protein
MKQQKTLAFLIVFSIILSSCIADSSSLDLVGRWQDVENPSMELEFSQGGSFSQYIYGSPIGYGSFEADGNIIILAYSSKCGEGNEVDCFTTLKFTVTKDILIITDSFGNVRYRKISEANNFGE